MLQKLIYFTSVLDCRVTEIVKFHSKSFVNSCLATVLSGCAKNVFRVGNVIERGRILQEFKQNEFEILHHFLCCFCTTADQNMEPERSFYQLIFCVPVSLWLDNSFYLKFRYILACENNMDVARNEIKLPIRFIFCKKKLINKIRYSSPPPPAPAQNQQ